MVKALPLIVILRVTDVSKFAHVVAQAVLSSVAFVTQLMVVASANAADSLPPPFRNELGRAEIVLPGFVPIVTESTRVELGAGRAYEWSQSPLPQSVSVRSRVIMRSMQLVLRAGGQEYVVAAKPAVTSSVGHHAEMEAASHEFAGVNVRVRSRIEFDGLATIEVAAWSPQRTTIDSVALRFSLTRDPDMLTLGFDPATMYNYRPYLMPECYRGSYKSALGFVSGDYGFWWLSDDLDRRLLGSDPVTSISCDKASLVVRQPLIAVRQKLAAPLAARFAFLASPVRELSGAMRVDRYASPAAPPRPEYGNRHLWWIDATAHTALPLLEYPPGARARLTAAEVKAYPGRARNRAMVRSWRTSGVERLPYTSLRTLSFLDPEIDRQLGRWAVEPAIKPEAAGDAPYPTSPARNILSLRGPGFADYLLARLSDIASELDVRGFYFDQASPTGSRNPLHLQPGATPESESTDILEMRAFFKRLATLLVQQGKDPLIYAHNSSAPIIPAFSFVTAMVQGEELMPELRNLDYQASLDIDFIRASYSTTAAGIPTVWLEELWSDVVKNQRPLRYRWADPPAWLASAEYEAAWRNFAAIALLHDLPMWSHAPLEMQQSVYRPMMQFGVPDSRFVGYWNLTRNWRSSPLLISAWVRRSDGRCLLVVANRTPTAKRVTGAQLSALLDPAALGAGRAVRLPDIAHSIAVRDFAFITTD